MGLALATILVATVALAGCIDRQPAGLARGGFPNLSAAVAPAGVFNTFYDVVFGNAPAFDSTHVPAGIVQYQAAWPVSDTLVFLSRDDDYFGLIDVADPGAALWLSSVQGGRGYQTGSWADGLNDFWGGNALFTADPSELYHYNGSWSVEHPFSSSMQTNALWGFSSTDVWAAGYDRNTGQGKLAHYDGTGWSFTPAPAPHAIESIWGASSNDVWAGGDVGTLLHWNGVAWDSVAPPGLPGEYILSISGTSASDVWALAVDSTAGSTTEELLRYDGTSWSAKEIPSGTYVAKIQAVSSTEAYAAGTGFWHYDAGTWTQINDPVLKDPITNADLYFFDMRLGYGRVYLASAQDSHGQGHFIIGSYSNLNTVAVQVTGSPPVPGIIVTATRTNGAPNTGEYHLTLTNSNGVATFHLPDGDWIFYARNLGDVGPSDHGFLLPRAPMPDSLEAVYGPLNTSATQGVNHVSVVYDPDSTNTSAVLDASAYVHEVANPMHLSGGGSHSIGLHFEGGATVSCTLLDDNGNPISLPTDKNVFLIDPLPTNATLPPLPAGVPGADLPRGLLTGVATAPAGGSDCSLAGVASTAADTAPPVLETNSVNVDGQSQVYATTLQVSQQAASTGATVPVVIAPQPRRQFTTYIADPWGDNNGPLDLGLVTAGWKYSAGTPSDVFVVAADIRGLGRYDLHLTVGGHSYVIPAVCEAKRCKLVGNGEKFPFHVAVRGTNAVVQGAASGNVVWEVTLDGVGIGDSVGIQVVAGPGRKAFDVAPNSGPVQITKVAGNGNTWLIAN